MEMRYFFVVFVLLWDLCKEERILAERERDKSAGYESRARPLYQYDMQLCLGRRQVKGRPDDSII